MYSNVYKRVPNHKLFSDIGALVRVVPSSSFSVFSLKDETEYKHCYRVLEVREGCSKNEAKSAFLKLAKLYHPDSNAETADASLFHEVERAYRKLAEKFDMEEEIIQNQSITNYENTSLTTKQGTLDELYAEHQQDDENYIAPQHRHYLSYGGRGYGTLAEREKQYQNYKVQKAVEHVYNHRMARVPNTDEVSVVSKEKRAAEKIKTKYGIDRMVEDLIQESISKGEFSNLKGSGKPLKYENHNPYVDVVTQKVNQILIENGFSPQWIMLEKEIRSELSSLKEKLKEKRNKLGPVPLKSSDIEQWKNYLKLLEDDVKMINKKINDYNLLVPLLNKQMVHVNLNRLAERCLAEQPKQNKGENSQIPNKTNVIKVKSNEGQSLLAHLMGLWR